MIRMFGLICIIACSSNVLKSQADTPTWEDMMGNPNISFYEIQEAYKAYWGNEEIPGGAGHKPYKRWEYLQETRINKEGHHNPLKRQLAFDDFSKLQSNNKSSSNTWTALGPFNHPSGNNGIGRVNVIAQHPTNSSILFAGSPAGGIWKSTDGGASWTTNSDFLTNLGVSDIVFHPSNPNTMYIATGDRDHNDTSTFGILKSTDGGNTWTITNFVPTAAGLSFYLIHRLIIHPSNGDIMIASTTNGVYRTTDGWNTWTEVLPVACLRHMQVKPTDPDIIYGTTSSNYCGSGGTAIYYRSTDNGQSWTQITLPHTTTIKRVAIGVTDDNPNVVYFLAAYNDSGNSNDFYALYKSTDSGATVTEVSVTTAPVLGSQQWYDWSFTVDENDENTLFAGGVGFRKSTDGGVTWTSSGSGVHVDHHFAKYFGSELFVGSDGGIWKSTNDGTSWSALNNGLAITQYYRISNAETAADRMLAGSQDNGTHLLIGSNWSHEFGGDGMDNAIDPNDETNLFVSYQYGHFFRSTNSGGSFSAMIDDNTTGTNGAWVTPIKIDESNTSTIYTGYDRIWKSTNDGATWTDPYGSALTSGSAKLRYIDVAPSNSNYIYTTDYSNLWKSVDGGTNWSLTTDPGNSIRWIEIDPTDENRLWVCSNDDIYESTNGGSSWSNITGSLPNIDMNTIVYDAGTNDALYVGTDLGVYYKDASMSDWTAFGTGLPNVIVLELDINEADNSIRAATFGRGVWEAPLTAIPCSIDNVVDLGIASCEEVQGTYARNLEVNYTSAPLSGTLDVNGQSFAITGSPQMVTLLNLPLDGNSVNVNVSFSADPSCSLLENNLFTNPAFCPCFILDAGLTVLPCNDQGTPSPDDDTFTFSLNPAGDNTGTTYSVTGDVTASNISYGSPMVFDNGGNGYLISNGNLSINIIDDNDPLCSLTNELVEAPNACSTNYVCSDAFEITSNGTYSASGPDQGNGGSQSGQNANWFYFVAPSSGLITVQSCGGGVDTRLFIHDGSCGSLNQIGTNDDFCEMSSGSSLYASYLEVCVSAGVTYYIEWDDQWSQLGFNFDFEFISGIPMAPTISSFPYNESFESVPNTWVLSCIDDMNWTHNSGTTPSNNTGPSAAFDGTYYLYTEATNNLNNIAYHIGPTFDLTNVNNPEFSFNYHMYGADMGTLSLELSNNGGNSWSVIWSQNGNQGDQWNAHTIDLMSYAGQTIMLRFKGSVGPAFTSDMAIDNISLIDTNPPNCPPVENVDQDPITNGSYGAEIINSTGVVPNGGNVEFNALIEVNLNIGFEAEVGSTFEISMGNCTSNNSQETEEEEN